MNLRRERSGLRTEYYPDDFGRKRFATVRYDLTNSGVPILTTKVIRTANTGASGGGMSVRTVRFTGDHEATSPTEYLVGETVTDAAGRTVATRSPDADGAGGEESATYTYAVLTGGKLQTTVSRPTTVGSAEVADETTTYYGSGEVYERDGTAVAGVRYTYGVPTTMTYRTTMTTILLDSSGATTSEQETVLSDPSGRTIQTSTTTGAAETYAYFTANDTNGLRGQLKSITDADGVVREFRFRRIDGGGRTRSGTPADGSGYDYTSTSDDRITETMRDVVDDSSLGPAYRTRSYVYTSSSTNTKALVSTRIDAADGTASRTEYFGSGLTNHSSWSRAEGTYGDGVWTETEIATDGTKTVRAYKDWRLESVQTQDSSSGALSKVSYSYLHPGAAAAADGFGWPAKLIEHDDPTTSYTPGSPVAADKVTSYTYEASGAVKSVTEVDAFDTGSGTQDIVTSYTRDRLGRVVAVTLPDATSQHTAYSPSGEVAIRWGAQTTPASFAYDEQGRMVEMHTYPSITGTSAPVPGTTPSDVTGWYYNSQTGWLETKYDDDSNETNYTYTAAGRLHTRTWARTLGGGGALTTTYSYSLASGKTGDDTGTSDILGDLTSVVYSDGTTPDLACAYDRLGRPSTVTQEGNSHSYAYDETTLVLETETVAYDTDGNGTADFTRVIDRYQDSLLRATGWELKEGSTAVHSASYGYDDAGRLEHVDPAYPLPGSPAFTYAYTEDGRPGLPSSVTGPAHTVTNTYEAKRGVLDAKTNAIIGGGAPTISAYDYSVNKLGQRTGVATSGSAIATATIGWQYSAHGEVIEADHSDTVNNQDRAYAYDGIGNRTRSADSLTLPGTDNYTSNSLNQYTAIAGHPGGRAHDADGNLTSGELPADPGSNSTLTWDAENRLVEVEVDGVTTTYAYDYIGRRISKKVGSATAHYFFYDGWNPVADYEGTTLSRRYLWGRDLSGSTLGAGGVGGLLSAEDSPQRAVYYPTYDGNGNVSEYIDSTGAAVAHYEYDPFGRTTISTGAKKDDFAHRFSTKPLDAETGLYYYGFRYYMPTTGRWLSRDPIGEDGGVNLYGFVGNDGVNGIDYLGKITVGFYGFNGLKGYNGRTGRGMVEGNEKMWTIGLGLGVKMYKAQRFNRDSQRGKAFDDIFDHLNTNGDKVYDEKDYKNGKAEPIKIFGWSWGGISAIQLAREIKESKKFCIKDVAVVAVIDPDHTKYMEGEVSVPGNVAKFRNWYQTMGDGPLDKDDHHGQKRDIDDPGSTDAMQHNENETGGALTRFFDGRYNGEDFVPLGLAVPINHRTIIWHVEQKLIDALK